MRYPVVIHHEKDSAYGVIVPDIPGCFSAGDTLDEAIENVREAIFAHLELVTQDGGDIPAGGTVETHSVNKNYRAGVWALVDVDVGDLLGPAERINITIPKRALEKIDNAVKYTKSNRSALLTEAALKFINEKVVRIEHVRAAAKPEKKAPKVTAYSTAPVPRAVKKKAAKAHA